MNAPTLLVALALAFIAYAALHSWLATDRCKRRIGQRWPRLVPAYRLLYNLIALLLLVPVAWLLWQWPGELLWQRPPPLRWLADGLALAAVVGFIHSLRSYDLGSFSGTRQWRERATKVDLDEGFRIGFWHRFVRHPWYSFALVILWTRDMNAAQLLFYALITLYFVIGSRLEERKLLARYGARYQRYRRAVPALVPLPWRWLRAAEAQALAGSEPAAPQ